MSNINLTRREIEERAHRIEQYFNRHDKDKKKTYAHFMDEGISKKTIYHILRRIEQSGEVTFKRPTGRKVSVCTPEMFEKVAELFKNDPSLSCREGARKLGIARTTIFRIMAKMRESNIETYKQIESDPRCPTCHQKIDPKLAETLKRKKTSKSKKDSSEEAKEDKADDDINQDDETNGEYDDEENESSGVVEDKNDVPISSNGETVMFSL